MYICKIKYYNLHHIFDHSALYAEILKYSYFTRQGFFWIKNKTYIDANKFRDILFLCIFTYNFMLVKYFEIKLYKASLFYSNISCLDDRRMSSRHYGSSSNVQYTTSPTVQYTTSPAVQYATTPSIHYPNNTQQACRKLRHLKIKIFYLRQFVNIWTYHDKVSRR